MPAFHAQGSDLLVRELETAYRADMERLKTLLNSQGDASNRKTIRRTIKLRKLQFKHDLAAIRRSLF